MSLQWRWNAYMGEITWKNKLSDSGYSTANIYEGNAPLIALIEWKENDGTEKYQPFLFFCDNTHAKRCLGITKNANGERENLYDCITKLRINKKHRDFKKIVGWFTQAFDNITIEVYTERSEEDADN